MLYRPLISIATAAAAAATVLFSFHDKLEFQFQLEYNIATVTNCLKTLETSRQRESQALSCE